MRRNTEWMKAVRDCRVAQAAALTGAERRAALDEAAHWQDILDNPAAARRHFASLDRKYGGSGRA